MRTSILVRVVGATTLALGLTLLLLVIPGPTGVSLPGGDIDVASAHLDPPGPPPIRVTVQVIGIATGQDQDDGVDGNAELEIDFGLTHAGHPPVVNGADVRISDNYDWDVFGGLGPGGVGGIQASNPASSPPGPIFLYAHDECTPMNRIDISVHLEEDDSPGVDDDLGNVPGGFVFLVPGVQTLATAPGVDGSGRVQIQVTTAPLANGVCDGTTVGGIAELPDADVAPLAAGDASGPGAALIGAVAGMVSVGVGALVWVGWALRRRIRRLN